MTQNSEFLKPEDYRGESGDKNKYITTTYKRDTSVITNTMGLDKSDTWQGWVK